MTESSARHPVIDERSSMHGNSEVDIALRFRNMAIENRIYARIFGI